MAAGELSVAGRPAFPAGADVAPRLFALTIAVFVIAALLVLPCPASIDHAVLPTLDLVLDTMAFIACASLTAPCLVSQLPASGKIIAAAPGYHAGYLPRTGDRLRGVQGLLR